MTNKSSCITNYNTWKLFPKPKKIVRFIFWNLSGGQNRTCPPLDGEPFPVK